MEFTVFTNEPVSLKYDDNYVTITVLGGRKIDTDARMLDLESVPITQEFADDIKSYSPDSKLEALQCIDLPEIWVGFDSTAEANQATEWYMVLLGVGDFLRKIFDAQVPEVVNLRVDIGILKEDSKSGCKLKPIFSSKLFTSQNGREVEIASKLKWCTYKNPNQVHQSWRSRKQWRTTMSLSLHVPCLRRKSSPKGDPLVATKRMLMNGILTDTTIIAGNGARVKCHRSFLASHSSVFAKMFQTNMREARNEPLELPGMLEESVRAFLDFLYAGETITADLNCVVCYELLDAGHKYDIKDLELKMVAILLVKDSNWFTADVTLRLFIFARNVGLENLKRRAMEILKMKYDEVSKLSACVEFFKKNPEGAMELSKFFALFK